MKTTPRRKLIVIIAIGYLLIIFISWEPITAPHKQEAVNLGNRNNLLRASNPALLLFNALTLVV